MFRTRFGPSRTAAVVAAISVMFGSGAILRADAQTPGLQSEPLVFVSLAPDRILDTRNGTGASGPGKLGPADIIELDVAGRTLSYGVTIPQNARAVMVNATITEADAPTYVTFYPTSQPTPNASTLNAVFGANSSGLGSENVPNMVTVTLGNDGDVAIFNLAGNTHVLADIAGYYIPAGAGGGASGDPIQGGPSDPVGPCDPGDVFLNTTTGQLFSCVDGEWVPGTDLHGPAGPQGAAGPAGAAGAAGAVGPAGADGADGPAGPAGADGVDGAAGPAGPAGADGVDGAVGPAGADGVDGATGPAGPIGPAGADGADGATGPAGPPGANGAQGATGATGATGPAGADGVVVGGVTLLSDFLIDIGVLNSGNYIPVATFTTPAAGDWILEASVDIRFDTAVISVGAAATIECKWDDNVGTIVDDADDVVRGASITAGVTVVLVTIPGLNTANIYVPAAVADAAVGTDFDLLCRGSQLLSINAGVVVSPAYTATQVTLVP